MERDGQSCVRVGCQSPGRLEVHHIHPLGDGSHSQTSCRHHQENLETLCHDHHVAVTTSTKR